MMLSGLQFFVMFSSSPCSILLVVLRLLDFFTFEDRFEHPRSSCFLNKRRLLLDVFVVDGWDNEETDQLKSVLLKEISNMEGKVIDRLNATLKQPGLNQDLLFPKMKFLQTGINITANHVDTPSIGSEAWEIDNALLNYEYKIATGSIGDLSIKMSTLNQEYNIVTDGIRTIYRICRYKGSFHNQEVAIKVLKSECLNEDVQRDFAQEIYIFR